MRKQSLVLYTLVASLFASTAIAANYDKEDEAAAFASSARAFAAEYGGAYEAKAMLTRAVAALKADKAGAIRKFNNNDPQFRDRDLFVFCLNTRDGRYTAHEAMVGQDARKLVDGAGRDYGRLIYANAADEQMTNVDYMSPIPGSTKLVPKRAFVTRVGDQVCGVSTYLVQ